MRRQRRRPPAVTTGGGFAARARPFGGVAVLVSCLLAVAGCAVVVQPDTDPAAAPAVVGVAEVAIEPGPAPVDAGSGAVGSDRLDPGVAVPPPQTREAAARAALAAAQRERSVDSVGGAAAAAEGAEQAGAVAPAATMLAAVDPRIVRVNAGGPAVSAGGVVWLQDQYYTTAGARFENLTLERIAGTDADDVYRTERNTGGDEPTDLFEYVVPIANGSYDVILHFAEIYFGTPGNPAAEPGQRVFDVALGGDTVLAGYDVFAVAGGSAVAVTESFRIDVTEGILSITVRNGAANRGKLSAFEIVPTDAGG